MATQTANPALRTEAFSQSAGAYPSRYGASGTASGDTMTVNGTVGKTFLLLAGVLAGALWTWRTYATTHDPASVSLMMMAGVIGGLIVAMITIFNKKASPITAPLYSVLEGLALGGISAMFDQQYPGIVMQAVGLTIGTCAAMLMAYTSGLIKPTQKFMMGVAAATGGVFIFYLISMVLSFFHIGIPSVLSSGPIGIAISAVVVVIAALNFVIDFEVIRQGADMGAPKYMEWYGAFGLMVTLIWCYMEILRLLARTRSRD